MGKRKRIQRKVRVDYELRDLKTCAQIEYELRVLRQDIEYQAGMSMELYERRQSIMDGSAILTPKTYVPEGYTRCFGKLIKLPE